MILLTDGRDDRGALSLEDGLRAAQDSGNRQQRERGDHLHRQDTGTDVRARVRGDRASRRRRTSR